MFKIFLLGIVVGAAATGGGLYAYQPVDLVREQTVVKVIRNGFNQEVFRINLPRDIVLSGSTARPISANLDWSTAAFLGDMQVSVFKLRDVNGRVVGIASRLVKPGDPDTRVSEWVLHLPARGSVYVVMDDAQSAAGTGYQGKIQEGTGEFDNRSGQVSEHFIRDAGTIDDPESAIELTLLSMSTERAE